MSVSAEARVSVSLGARSYDIHIAPGLLNTAGERLGPFARGPVPVVTDETVADLYLDRFLKNLKAAGIDARAVVMVPGEESKSFSALEQLTSALLQSGVDRGGLIVALGGGVIGDLTGFAAAILKRGVDFAQVPPTLLAQVDSSVGGKTAINTAEGKNLVGAFHQPRIVLADTDVLGTLTPRELRAGYAEVVKYGVLGDADFFGWLEANAAKALAGDKDAMVHAVAHSCGMKAAVVARDEREAGERALLNVGHTFGHALEAATGYSDRLKHGEGVAIGMALAFKLSAALGLCAGRDATRFIRHLEALGLPADISAIPGPRPDAETLLSHMKHDKKVKDGKINYVLLRGLGQAFVTADVPADAVKAVLGA
jgi:3-dehydroquinate synthase